MPMFFIYICDINTYILEYNIFLVRNQLIRNRVLLPLKTINFSNYTESCLFGIRNLETWNLRNLETQFQIHLKRCNFNATKIFY